MRRAAHTPGLMLAVMGSGVILTAPSAAQSVSSVTTEAAKPDASDPGLNANEIIVTAQRRSERLEDVPVAITAVSGGLLEKSGVRQLGNIGQIAAGVQVNRGGAFTQPAVRGVSTMVLGFGFENNVAVYVDGFYQPDAVSINGDLVNLSSMQILKGPQGTLYGRNATGGAIVLETLPPSDHFTVSGEGSYGRFDDKRFKGYLSVPIATGIKFSVAGFYRHSDSYIKTPSGDPAVPIRNATIRSKLELTPTDDVTVTLGYNHVFSDDSRGLAYTYIGYYAYAAVPATAGRATTPGTLTSNVRPDASVRLDEYTAKVKWDTAIGTLTSYTGYAHRLSHSVFDIDGSYAQLQGASALRINQDTFQQSLDYAINVIDRLNVVAGVSYYKDVFNNRDSARYAIHVPPAAPDALQNIRSSSEAMAVYIDGTYQLTNKLFFTAGARYADEKRTFRYTETPGYAGAILLPDRSPVAADFKKVTPRAVLRYELGNRTNVYASYTQGFRSGTFNIAVLPTAAEAGTPAQPEKITSYEIGFKTASSRFRFDTAAYYYDYRNLQVAVTATGPTRVILFNAPKAQIYGAEANVSYTPFRALNLRGGVAYVHARYKNFTDDAGNPIAFGTGITASGLNNTTQRQDWTNQQMARAPTWTVNGGAEYSVDFAKGQLTGNINASYTSSYVVTNPSLYGPNAPAALANKQRYRQKAYGLVNIGLDWAAPGNHLHFGIYADNVTNTHYALVYSGSGLGDYKQYADPVTYGVRAGFKF